MTFTWPLALIGLAAIPLLAGLQIVARDGAPRGRRFANPASSRTSSRRPRMRRYVPPRSR